MSEFWLADSEARVLGPIGVDVIRTLHARGKLQDVRAVSKDGKRFVPLREMPELQLLLSAPATVEDASRAQAEATRQIREWLTAISGRSTSEVFKVPPSSSRDAWRAAFFGLVHRYVPSRLPPDTTPELRLACEDAFLALSERMVEIERQFRPPPPAVPATPAPQPQPPEAAEPAPSTRVSMRGQAVSVQLSLKRGDARPFVGDPEFGWQQDCLVITTSERPAVGAPAELVIGFEGHVTQLHAAGRVQALRPGGIAVRLSDLGEAERSLIRTWVARSTVR